MDQVQVLRQKLITVSLEGSSLGMLEYQLENVLFLWHLNVLRDYMSVQNIFLVHCQTESNANLYVYIQPNFSLNQTCYPPPALQRFTWRQMRIGLTLLEEKLSTELLPSLEREQRVSKGLNRGPQFPHNNIFLCVSWGNMHRKILYLAACLGCWQWR